MSDRPLTEFELIARLTQRLPTSKNIVEGIGDDCTILALPGDDLLLATCDSQVEGVHFALNLASPEQIGRKALAINLSDIAAMGGTPRYALISLILPKNYSVEWLEQLYTGLRMEAQRYALDIVGGNIAGAGESHQYVIDITLLGTVRRDHAITRGGAHPGDILCVTGTPGDSAAGLYTLFHPHLSYLQEAREYVRTRCLTPQPRIHEGQILGNFGPQTITAMLDISDGLSGDVAHICERSQVGVAIDVAHLPTSIATRAIAASAGHDALDWVLHGGEDYELLFTVAPDRIQEVITAVQEATGTIVTAIGTVIAPDAGRILIFPDGHKETLVSRSWDHLRA